MLTNRILIMRERESRSFLVNKYSTFIDWVVFARHKAVIFHFLLTTLTLLLKHLHSKIDIVIP